MALEHAFDSFEGVRVRTNRRGVSAHGIDRVAFLALSIDRKYRPKTNMWITEIDNDTVRESAGIHAMLDTVVDRRITVQLFSLGAPTCLHRPAAQKQHPHQHEQQNRIFRHARSLSALPCTDSKQPTVHLHVRQQLEQCGPLQRLAGEPKTLAIDRILVVIHQLETVGGLRRALALQPQIFCQLA